MFNHNIVSFKLFNSAAFFLLTATIVYMVLTGHLPYPAIIIKVQEKYTYSLGSEKKKEKKILN